MGWKDCEVHCERMRNVTLHCGGEAASAGKKKAKIGHAIDTETESQYDSIAPPHAGQ
jgi:hypothetical protein